MSLVKDLARHIDALGRPDLSRRYLPFHLGGVQAGWLGARQAQVLRDRDAVHVHNPALLPGLARDLAEAGEFPWRGEAFDVRARPDYPVLTQVDRGALPWFGLWAEGVHVNGLVRQPGGVGVWVARRAANRLLDPGKLDHVCAGGIAAGFSPAQTLIKEAAEEAGFAESVVRKARFAGTLRYLTERPEGLRRDRLHCYDLWLDAHMQPRPADGEVAHFELWPLERVIATLRDGNEFKFNVALVLIGLIVRLGVAGTRDTAYLNNGLRRAGRAVS